MSRYDDAIEVFNRGIAEAEKEVVTLTKMRDDLLRISGKEAVVVTPPKTTAKRSTAEPTAKRRSGTYSARPSTDVMEAVEAAVNTLPGPSTIGDIEARLVERKHPVSRSYLGKVLKHLAIEEKIRFAGYAVSPTSGKGRVPFYAPLHTETSIATFDDLDTSLRAEEAVSAS